MRTVRTLAAVAILLATASAAPAGAAPVPAGKFHVTDATLPVVGSAMAWTGEAAYLFGGGQHVGSNGRDSIWRYDPGTDNFTQMQARLPNATQGGSAVYLSGAVYLFDLHWMQCPSDYCRWVRDPHVYRFDPGQGRLQTMTALLPPGFPAGTRGVALGDAVYFLGGGADDDDAADTVWVYRPASDRFELAPARLPAPKARAQAATDGRAVYLFGGSYNRDIVRYDPGAGTAETLAAGLPWAGGSLQWPGVAWDGHRFLVVPERDLGFDHEPVWVDPASGDVTPLGHGLPYDRAAPRIIPWDGGFLFLGGRACANDDHSILRFDPDGHPAAPNRPPTLHATLGLFAGRLTIDLCGARDPDGVVVATGQEGQPGSRPDTMLGGMTAQTLPVGQHHFPIWAEDEQGARAWANVTVFVGDEAEAHFAVLEEGCKVTATSATVGRWPGTAVKATWDWGDGQPPDVVTDTDPAGNPVTPVATHIYARGDVTIRLTLEDGTGTRSGAVRLDLAACGEGTSAPTTTPTDPSTTVRPEPTVPADPTVAATSSSAPASPWPWLAALLALAAMAARRRLPGQA